MTDSERKLGQRWFTEVWNNKDREAIAQMLAPDAKIHDGGIHSIGPAGFYPFFDKMQQTLSGIKIDIEQTLVDGDNLCVRWSCTAKHAAAGKPIHVTGISIMRIQGGKIAEAWQNWDMLGFLQQSNDPALGPLYMHAV